MEHVVINILPGAAEQIKLKDKLTLDSIRRESILIEFGGKDVYFRISLRLDRLEVVEGLRTPWLFDTSESV